MIVHYWRTLPYNAVFIARIHEIHCDEYRSKMSVWPEEVVLVGKYL